MHRLECRNNFHDFHRTNLLLHCPYTCMTRGCGPWRFGVVSPGECWNSLPNLSVCWPCYRQVENLGNPKLLHGVSAACSTDTSYCNFATLHKLPLCSRQGAGICTPAPRYLVYDVTLKRDKLDVAQIPAILRQGFSFSKLGPLRVILSQVQVEARGRCKRISDDC